MFTVKFSGMDVSCDTVEELSDVMRVAGNRLSKKPGPKAKLNGVQERRRSKARKGRLIYWRAIRKLRRQGNLSMAEAKQLYREQKQQRANKKKK